MAYTKKTSDTKVENKVEEIKDSSYNYEELRRENEQLKTDFAKLNEQMTALMEQILKINNAQPIIQAKDSNRDVEVYSMVVGTLILSTTGRADGKIYKFNEQFESQSIPLNDLKEICRTMKKFAQGGKFFINDEEAVREIGLISSYREILNKNVLENIFELSPKDFANEYNRVNKAQKSIIETMASIKCLTNEDIDANILKTLTKITGRDYLSIEPLPEEYLNEEG